MFDGGHDTAGSTDRWDFFVSYTQADRPWAEWIAWQLEADGFRVLLQAWDMVAGTNWTHAMQSGIRDATRTLAVLSAAYLDSAYGTREWQAAVAADPDSARRRLIPVRIEDCARPGLLGQVVSFDLFGMAEHRARGALMARVREVIAGRAKPAREPLFPGLPAVPGPRVLPNAAASPAFPGASDERAVPMPDRPAEFHALLIGVASYEDERLPALPWLSGMLDTAAEQLESVGYRTEIHDRSRSGTSAVKAAVHGFLSSAAPGATLLLLLAGNGVHRAGRGADAGRDFLVPADATVGYQPFWDLCVPVDWSRPLARTAAARVLILVDGSTWFEDGVRALVTDEGWGAGRLDAASAVDVAYLYRGQAAAGTGPDDEPRDPTACPSLTRALVDVLSTRPLPGTLGELHAALERAMSPLVGDSAAHGSGERPGTPDPRILPGQRAANAGRGDGSEYEGPRCLLRPLSSCDPHRFRPFPPRPGGDAADTPPHAWTAAADHHRAWERTADNPVTAALRAATGALVDRLGRAYDEAVAVLADDPWHDPDLARRMARRVEFLVGKLPPGPEELSAADAALLVAGPYLHQTVWTILVARATVAHPSSADVPTGRVDRVEFDAFTRTHPRLVRRIERAQLSGDQTSAAFVAWWLAHKWCESNVTARWEAVLRELFAGLGGDGVQETLAAEVFRTERVAEILTALRATPTFLNQSGRVRALCDLVTVAPATSEEMPLRERLVAYLLAIGQRMALELAALPVVLVEHLGVADAVDLGEVRTALRRAEWQGRGRSTRALSVECRHPALQVALERHTASLDALLAEAHRATAEIPALAGMPTHATADDVRAAEIDGHPGYTSAGAQFRLAEDRVQELLMGEQLYENRALAVRELYQNALDACRYRRARTEYLGRTTGRPSTWTGRIDFRQGFEPDGTPYIECRDNGIGMGYREISDVFAEAGTRTVDLPEVVEEMGRWAACDPPVEFHPNSRFGVGVLSYFMIADEIRVETCRLGPDGRPGELLRVTIAGPGNLFRIEPLGPGGESGTSVRLYLSRDPKRPPISCVDILRRILWVAEFDTHATEGAALEHWPAGQLAPSAPVGQTDPLQYELRRLTTQIVNAGRGVWWCNGVGAILADGLWVGEAVLGVVLDLTGRLVPELSVDRNKIRKLMDEPAVDALLSAAIPVLRASDVLEVTVDWLIAFAYSFPLVADAVLEAMAADGEFWVGTGGVRVPVARTGLLAVDSGLGPVAGQTDRPVARSGTNFLRSYLVPDTTFFARMADWARAEDGFPPARDVRGDCEMVVPSDLAIMVVRLEYSRRIPARYRAVVGFVAGRLRCPPRTLDSRMRRLGYQVPSLKSVEVVEITDLDQALLSSGLDGEMPIWAWDGRDHTVAPGHVLAAASRLLMHPDKIVDRLRVLGLAVWPPPGDPADAAPMDLVLQSAQLDGRYPWLPAGRVGRAHVFRSALHTESTFVEVCARLRRFGYRTPQINTAACLGAGERDAFIVSRDTEGALSSVPVPTSYLSGLRSDLTGSRDNNVGRLRELGFPVARTLRLPAGSRPNIADRFPVVDEYHPLWTVGAPIDRVHLLLLANAAKMRYPVLVALLDSNHYTVAQVSEPRSNRIARIAEINDFVLVNASRIGRFEIRHLLNMAGDAGLPIDVSLDLLAEVGVATPDVGDLEITNDDCIILSSFFDGNANLVSMDFVPAAQVRAAATRLRREPEDVALRLRQLGLATADPGGWAASPVRSSDIALLARDFDDHDAFLQDGNVSAAHVLRAAAHTGETPRALADRLGELGFDVDPVADVELTAAEERTVVDLLDVSDDPSLDHGWAGLSRASILATAYRDSTRGHSRGPAELAAWIGGLGAGLDTYAGARFPDDLCFNDVDLLSWALDGEPPWLAGDEISPGHVLAAAGITGRPTHEIASRLRHLGFTIADLPDRAPDDVDAVDVVLLSKFLDGKAPRLTERQVPLAHVYNAACVLSCDVVEIRERYDRLGLEILGEPRELDRVTRGHATVAFYCMDTAASEADLLSPAQILAVAQFTGRDPASVRDSFTGLGLPVPEAGTLPDMAAAALTAQDAILLSSCLDGRGPWLGWRPAPLAHVIGAAGYLRWSPRRVVSRLAELGCAVPTAADSALDIVVDGVDRQLADLLTDTSDAYVERPVSRAEMLAASFRFRWTPSRIVARMVELGFDVPSVTSQTFPEAGATGR
ncbi:TIR domain-containing protein [Parafrankia sp. BMG5.11]|nr:TIR domain-containing protein [Parafrankia sp. BMG5.11]